MPGVIAAVPEPNVFGFESIGAAVVGLMSMRWWKWAAQESLVVAVAVGPPAFPKGLTSHSLTG